MIDVVDGLDLSGVPISFLEVSSATVKLSITYPRRIHFQHLFSLYR
jgi:hypothetical protein